MLIFTVAGGGRICYYKFAIKVNHQSGEVLLHVKNKKKALERTGVCHFDAGVAARAFRCILAVRKF